MDNQAAKQAAVKKLRELKNWAKGMPISIGEYEEKQTAILTEYETAIRASIAEEVNKLVCRSSNVYDAEGKKEEIPTVSKEEVLEITGFFEESEPNKGGE